MPKQEVGFVSFVRAGEETLRVPARRVVPPIAGLATVNSPPRASVRALPPLCESCCMRLNEKWFREVGE